MVKKKQDQVFFAGIQDPIEIRRSLLESSKEMLQMLQRHEKFKEVRNEKHENIVRLKADIKDMQKLFSKLNTSLPVTHLRVLLKQEKEKLIKANIQKDKKKGKKSVKQKVEQIKDEVVQKPISKRELSELEKLESELSAIENKLGSLV